MENELKLTKLQNAVQALDDAIEIYNENTDERLTKVLRSGVIHNFETAYEVSWKYMKRWLEINVKPDIVVGVIRKEFYRIASENGLIANPLIWLEFHLRRNQTSHIYLEVVAQEVLNAAFEFLPCAKELLQNLEASNGSHN
jgi:nucleotidyltransferase substrate binding protein (TIGR01987 family)